MSFLQLATIRKEEDPILKTQTEPILYKQKVEEEKDGVKGAPTPSFNYYQKERFLVDPPVDQKKEEEAKPSVLEDSEVEEAEDFQEESEEEEDSEADWWDWEDEGEQGEVDAP